MTDRPMPQGGEAASGDLPARLAFLEVWTWRQPGQHETNDEWLARTTRLREQLVEAAAGWLTVGQPVVVHHEARIVGGGLAGRTGTVHRLCSEVFADHAVVRFAPVGRQRVERTQMLPLEVLEPAGNAA